MIWPFRRASAAAKAGDVETLALSVAEDIVAMSPNDTTVYGRAEYRSWWEEYFQYFRITALDEPERSVIVHGRCRRTFGIHDRDCRGQWRIANQGRRTNTLDLETSARRLVENVADDLEQHEAHRSRNQSIHVAPHAKEGASTA